MRNRFRGELEENTDQEEVQLEGSDRNEEKRIGFIRGDSIPLLYFPLVLGFLLVLGLWTAQIDDALPQAVTVKEAGFKRFSEERAWIHLRDIVGTGPRVAGTKYHLTKTIELKSMLDKIAQNSDRKIHIDWQLVSGDYPLKAFVNAYGNLSNIIAVLEGESGFNKDGSTNTSILFNCHYDSVPTSPGASDNAIFCATLVETLYLFSKQNNTFKHNIVFLFNGAEENPLQGASGFLRHPWSKGVTGLVNLDAAGTNCKPIMFQVSDPRVAASYAKSVRKPNAQSFGEVLFASGMIPSDTDFRVFRDFGQIYGVDIAFSKVGHVYHTRFDSLPIIKRGVLQHSGDMVHDLAREMANSDLYYRKTEPSTSVYWDYLNLFMYNYKRGAAVVIDALLVMFGFNSVLYYFHVIGFRKNLFKSILCSMGIRICSSLAGSACVAMLTVVLMVTSHQLRYLTNSWLVVPMFWFPFIVGSVLTSQTLDSARKIILTHIGRMAEAKAATRCLLIGAASVLLIFPSASTIRYMITIPLFLMALAAFVSLTAVSIFRLKAYQQLLLELVINIPSQMLYFVMAIKVNALMLPIMGRSPTLYPDFNVAILNIALVVISSTPLSGIELLFSRCRKWPIKIIAACTVVWIVVCFTPLSLYSDDPSRPVLQRHYWFNTEIISHNKVGEQTDKQTGIWFTHTEVNTPRSVLEHAASANIVLANIRHEFPCDNRTYCNLPMFLPNNLKNVKNSMWVDWEAPSKSDPEPQFILNNKTCSKYNCTLEFSMNGPPHMALTLWPRINVTLVSWSFESPVKNTTVLLDRPVYFVYYARGTYEEYPKPIIVSFTFEGDIFQQELLDISFHAHRIQHEDEFTDSYKRLLSIMPAWFNVATFLSVRYNYVF